MLALKQWKTKTSTQSWNTTKIIRAKAKNLFLSDCYFINLANSEESSNLIKLIKFLESWHVIFKHTQEIFYCLEKNYSLLNFNIELFKVNLLSKTKQKVAF